MSARCQKHAASVAELIQVFQSGGQVGGEGNCSGLIRLCLFPLDANQPDSQVGSIQCESEDLGYSWNAVWIISTLRDDDLL